MRKLENVINKVNKIIKKNKITQEFIDKTEDYLEQCTALQNELSAFLNEGAKFLVRIKMPKYGIYTTRVELN